MSSNSGIKMLIFEKFTGYEVRYDSSKELVSIFFLANNERFDVELTKDQAQSLITKLQDAIK